MREFFRRCVVSVSASLLLCTALAVRAEQDAASAPQANKQAEQQQKPPIEWGTWDGKKAPLSRYGVGISGEIEAELSRLDRSNLLDNAGGVEVQGNQSKAKASSKTKDIKRMMAELEAMEAEIKQEIENESEF